MSDSPEETKAPKGRAKKEEKPAEVSKPKLPTVDQHKAKLPAKQKFLHAAASALHGWHEHEHHEGSPLELSADDYAAALEAAAHRDLETGRYVPHPAALCRHMADRKAAAAKAREDKARAEKARQNAIAEARKARKSRRAK